MFIRFEIELNNTSFGLYRYSEYEQFLSEEKLNILQNIFQKHTGCSHPSLFCDFDIKDLKSIDLQNYYFAFSNIEAVKQWFADDLVELLCIDEIKTYEIFPSHYLEGRSKKQIMFHKQFSKSKVLNKDSIL